MPAKPIPAKPIPAEQIVLTVPEIVRLTGACRSTVDKLIRLGDLPSKKMLGRIVVPRSAVMRLIGVEEAA